jgi:hypothetical protein
MYTNPRQAAQAERTRRNAKVTGIRVRYRSNGKTFEAHVRTTRNATGATFTAHRSGHNTAKGYLVRLCLYTSFDHLRPTVAVKHNGRGLVLNDLGKRALNRARQRRDARGLPPLTPGVPLRADRYLWTPDVLRALELAAQGDPDAQHAARVVLATHT